MNRGEMLGVRLPADAAAARTVAMVVASLPRSLSVMDDGVLALVAGTGEWCDAATLAIDGGARGVVIDRPAFTRPAQVDALAAAAERASASVMLRWRWASHPAVADAIAAWPPGCDDLTLVDSLTSGEIGRAGDALLEQLYLITLFAGVVRDLRVDGRTPHGCIARGLIDGGRPVALSVTMSARPSSAVVRFLGAEEAREIALTDTETWRPASAFRASAEGESCRPPIFESADRAVWRRLHEAVVGEGSRADLAAFAQAARTFATIGDRTW